MDEPTLCAWTLPLAVMRAFRPEREVAPEQVYRVSGGKAPARRCPICLDRLLLVPWPRAEGSEEHVDVDVCPRHGAWFDAGELARIREWAAAEQVELVAAAQAFRESFLWRLLEVLRRLGVSS